MPHSRQALKPQGAHSNMSNMTGHVLLYTGMTTASRLSCGSSTSRTQTHKQTSTQEKHTCRCHAHRRTRNPSHSISNRTEKAQKAVTHSQFDSQIPPQHDMHLTKLMQLACITNMHCKRMCKRVHAARGNMQAQKHRCTFSILLRFTFFIFLTALIAYSTKFLMSSKFLWSASS